MLLDGLARDLRERSREVRRLASGSASDSGTVAVLPLGGRHLHRSLRKFLD